MIVRTWKVKCIRQQKCSVQAAASAALYECCVYQDKNYSEGAG
ncbi:DUF1496 domain-containing protein [Shigella flexneri]